MGPPRLAKRVLVGPPLLVGPPHLASWLARGPSFDSAVCSRFVDPAAAKQPPRVPYGYYEEGGSSRGPQTKPFGGAPPTAEPPWGALGGRVAINHPFEQGGLGGIPPSCLVSVCAIVVYWPEPAGCRSSERVLALGGIGEAQLLEGPPRGVPLGKHFLWSHDPGRAYFTNAHEQGETQGFFARALKPFEV